MKIIISSVVVAGLLLIGYWLYTSQPKTEATPPTATSTTNNQAPWTIDSAVSYQCNNDVYISAVFRSTSKEVTLPVDAPPQPTGNVLLTLANGEQKELKQTISADGARYANTDESFIFWSKGRGVLVLENDQISTTYQGCVELAPATSQLTQSYYHFEPTFSVRYPANWHFEAINSSTKTGLEPEVQVLANFTVSDNLVANTNLSSDSGLRLATIASTTTCTPTAFLSNTIGETSTTTINGTDYLIASSSDAGAGNRYHLTAYTILNARPCLATINYIHSTVLENHPANTVEAYNKQTVTNDFNAIRNSLRVALP